MTYDQHVDCDRQLNEAEDRIIVLNKIIGDLNGRIKGLELVKRIDDEMFYDIKQEYLRTADLQVKIEWREKKVKQALKG